MKINENTHLSIGVAALLIGGAAWMTQAYFQSVSNAAEIQEMKGDIKDMQRMKEDIAVIKSDMKRILKGIELMKEE